MSKPARTSKRNDTPISDDTTITLLRQPGSILDPLTEIARDGARQMLAAALKAEAASFVAQFSDELLPDGRQRVVPPGLTVGDGALGFWNAMDEVFPGTRHQRCWFHKTANVLNHFPKSGQPATAADLRNVSHAATRAEALAAIETFKEKYAAKYAKGVACLTKDIDALLSFYDFPAEHWDHLRTSNPIESVFATVRHRTVRTKGALSQKTAKLMVFSLVRAASQKWRKLSGPNQLPRVIGGVKITDGVALPDPDESRAA